MQKEVHDLVQSVRGLGVELTGKPAPKCIKISGDTGDFAERLRDVQIALEAFDAATASGTDMDAKPEAVNDPQKLRKALDGLLRFIQTKGLNIAECDDIVRNALELEDADEAKKSKSTLPSFVPSKLKKRRGSFKPRVNIYPDRPGEASLSDLRKIVHELSVTESILGHTMAKPEASFERMQRKMGSPFGLR